MSDILSEAEIESLLHSAEQEPGLGASAHKPEAASVKEPPAGRPRRAGRSFEPYDFRRPDKFSKDQLRTLQMVHETFSRLAASSLSAYLRTPVNFELISVEQVPFDEYLRSINKSSFTICSLQPLTGQAVLEIEFGLVFTIVDRLLGGPGKAITREVLTDIERPLVRQTIEKLLGSLKNAWEGVVLINPSIEGMETSSQFVQIAPPGDIVVTLLFEVRIGAQRGAMSMCVPYVVLKPIASKLSAQKWFSSGPKKVSPASRQQLTEQLMQTEVTCAVVLGTAPLTTGELIRLKAGDVIRLEQRAGDPIPFEIAGRPILLGRPAIQGKNLVFSVSGPMSA